MPPVAQKRHAARQGLHKAGHFLTAEPAAVAASGHGQSAVAGGGRPNEANQPPTEASELDAQLGSLEVGRCSPTLPPPLPLPLPPYP